MAPAIPPQSVVLLGAGHTHLHVLKHWRDRPLPGVALTCISDFPVATYSGMLTGVLAGDYQPCAMEVPLAPLCGAAGAALIVGQVSAVDLTARQVQMADGRVVPFGLLSVGGGSRPVMHGVTVGDTSALVPIKPMQTFLDRLREALTPLHQRETPPRVAVVGGGAAGVEIALCVPAYIQAVAGAKAVMTLIAAGPLLTDCTVGLVRRASAVLERRRVVRITGRVVSVDEGRVGLESGDRVDADVVIWATDAAPRPVLDAIALPRDVSGFLLTTDTLCSTADAGVFAVGDAGAIEHQPVPKAGVHAVRQGPVLLDNLRRRMAGEPLRRYRPQRSFLKLLNAGGGHAIGEWRGISFGGWWCRRLKDAIDSRFIAQFRR